ncbi:hypothetical protein [uncultured Chryseobacterium sp.]|uniref:hypothetical protein n=1 Tax=uncultured Chryseobacterium sp. TaxID=259322 RepID=UPI0025F64479|nr:hypothetical protein [uncultured Chryseobacterium sp.]
MRKLIICAAIAAMAVSCKKVQAGGNKKVIKLEEGVERYSDDEQTSGEQDKLSDYRADMHGGHETPAKTDTVAVKPADEAKPAEAGKPAETHTPQTGH